VSVPHLPDLPDDVVARHERAHRRLADAHRSSPPHVQRLFTLLQRRLVVESLAYVQPTLARPHDQLLVPAPRSFLTRTHELRLLGAEAVFRHIDSRLTMVESGAIDRVLQRSTPVVFHALLEGLTPSGRETNPGMLRATPTAWKPEANSFMHPPAGLCDELVDEAMDVALRRDAPACARAGWLTFTMLSIHPFVDGNGRTSRALYLTVAADDLELGLDWGVLEQWAVARRAYVDALQAGQQVERYDGAIMDAAPFMSFATLTSSVGADLCRARVDHLTAAFEALIGREGRSPAQAAVLLAVDIERIVVPAQLAAMAGDEMLVAADELLRAGALRWAERPPSRRTSDRPEISGLVRAERR
jgi:hypothetical protein